MLCKGEGAEFDRISAIFIANGCKADAPFLITGQPGVGIARGSANTTEPLNITSRHRPTKPLLTFKIHTTGIINLSSASKLTSAHLMIRQAYINFMCFFDFPGFIFRSPWPSSLTTVIASSCIIRRLHNSHLHYHSLGSN
jgi:hypothetical protein